MLTYNHYDSNMKLRNCVIVALSWFVCGCTHQASTGTESSIKESEEVEYRNPVYKLDCADPTIWRADDGMFYCMHTMGTKPGTLLKSTNLVDWEDSGIKPIDETEFAKCRKWGEHVWAPDVAVVNGRRMAYLTLYFGLHDASIVALKEVSPLRFEYVGVITRGVETGIDDTIDPEVVTDEATGKVWLFFGSMGGIHRIQLNSSGTALAEGAEYVHVAGVHGSTNPNRSKVFEGCYLHYHEGYWYLFCSSGFYNDHTYTTRVGRSKTLDGVFVDRNGFKMTEGNAETVIRSDENDYFYGPGHDAEIFTDKKGNDWILYHCHNKGIDNAARPLMLQQVEWGKDGWPVVKGGKPVSRASAPEF